MKQAALILALLVRVLGDVANVDAAVLSGQPVALRELPTSALVRDRHTTLLAHFDAPNHSDADYARLRREEVGFRSDPSAPGRFGGGVAVSGENGYVMYAGLDNIGRWQGTVEFWAKSRANPPIWNDGKTRWLFLAFPERAGFPPKEGMAPYPMGVFKSAGNELVFIVAQKATARHALGVALSGDDGWQLRLPAAALQADGWHHILASYDLRPPGRLWLLVDGQGVTAPLGLPPSAPAPNPGYQIFFGGLSSLPGDNMLTSDCDLDELRIQAVSVADRLKDAPTAPKPAIDEGRLLECEDTARAAIDKLLSLQRHGGWHDYYQFPTYEPAEWGWFGRGVNLWFAANAQIGNLLLRAWRVWDDDRYLDGAVDLARMLAETQFPIGGWNFHYAYTRGKYLPSSEHIYIAQTMQSNPIRFLVFLGGLTGDERAKAAVRRAMEFHLQAQAPAGWWGWEAYPASHKGPYGHPALNDAVTPQAMQDLFVMYWLLRDPRCVEAIHRGAEWILAAQLGPPTHGWADQYDEKNQPVWMRNFEPPAVSMQAVGAVIPVLTMMYDVTGDERYLAPLRKCLSWLDSVPDKDRGWLWYDPRTQRPVVAYHNEMLPVDHPKAIQEIIPRLADHYGVKVPWPAESIRGALALRKAGPVYPALSGWKPRKAFAEERLDPHHAAEAFRRGPRSEALARLKQWLAGGPAPGLVVESRDFGRQFDPMEAARLAAQLIDDVEAARVALGDLPADRQPRFHPGVWGPWVYAFPDVDLYDLPRPTGASRPSGPKP